MSARGQIVASSGSARRTLQPMPTVTPWPRVRPCRTLASGPTRLSAPIEARLESPDGINRVFSFDAPFVQSASQFQRLLKQKLQRLQYQGEYSADFGIRGWLTGIGRIVKLSHPSLAVGTSNSPQTKIESPSGRKVPRDPREGTRPPPVPANAGGALGRTTAARGAEFPPWG